MKKFRSLKSSVVLILLNYVTLSKLVCTFSTICMFCTDFNSWKEVDDFIQEKCEKCLDKFSNEMESMKKIARNIVTVLTSYLVVLEINGEILLTKFALNCF